MSQRGGILVCDWLAANTFQKNPTVVRGTGSLPNYKLPSSRTPSTVGLLGISSDFFSLGQFLSFHNKFLFVFYAGSSLSLVTVALSCSAKLSDPDYIGINCQKPTTNFAQTVTRIFFLCSSRLAFY